MKFIALKLEKLLINQEKLIKAVIGVKKINIRWPITSEDQLIELNQKIIDCEEFCSSVVSLICLYNHLLD